MAGPIGDRRPVSDDRDRVPVSVAWILLAALGAALLLTALMRGWPGGPGGPSASFPAEAQGRPVISVVDALAIQADDDSSDIAVSGWFQQPFAFSCPAPVVPLVPVIEGPCAMTGWLLAEPESVVHITIGANSRSMETSSATGPSFETVFDGPGTAWARPLPERGDSVPTPVVLIGHFDDPRAAGCQPENQVECHERFVVSVVAWADGVDNP
jgi:hypothetical protein